jgi:segregation and condensation protein A
MANFAVKAGEFEGPLDLLLGLVEERKLHISQVALAAVADDFIAFLKDHPATKAELADFVLVAATLMLIKSAALLPNLEFSPDEKESMEELERRLKLYQEIKSLGQGLKKLYGRQPLFARQPTPPQPVFTPSAELSASNLANAMAQLLKNLPLPAALSQVVVKKVINLEEVMVNLMARVERAISLSFRDFIKDKKEKLDVIVSFLGLLELVKRGLVAVEQSDHFADIKLSSAQTTLPRY